MSVPIAQTQTLAKKPNLTFKGHTNTVRGFIYLPNGQQVITCSEDGSLRLWNLENGLQIGKDWRDGESPLYTIALSPDGRTVASGSEDGAVRMWNIETGKVAAKWTGHNDRVWSVSWSRDGQRVLSGSADGIVRVRDVKNGKTILGPVCTGCQAMCVTVYSPDETMVATSEGNWGTIKDKKLIKIWDAKTFELVETLKEPDGWPVWCLAWTNGGKELISGSTTGVIRKWNTTTWKQSAVLTDHTTFLTQHYSPNDFIRHSDIIRAIAISPNGCILASASYNGTARLWNLKNNQPIGSPLQHSGLVYCVSFSAHGGLLATGCHDDNAYTWDVSAILKEAGFGNLVLDSNTPQELKPVIDTNATRSRAVLLDNTRRLPPKFFDDTGDRIHSSSTGPPSHSFLLQSSVSRPRALIDRISLLFRPSHFANPDATSHGTPIPSRLLNSTPTHFSQHAYSGSDQRQPTVEVPCTRGDPVCSYFSHVPSHQTLNRGMSTPHTNKQGAPAVQPMS